MFEDFSFCTECEHYDQNDRLCKLFDRTMVAGCPYSEERKPRNNFERFKAMSPEELAAYIDEHTSEAMWCNSPPEECPPEGECVKCILNWLKEACCEQS